jgi:DNA-directed RNA polymerase subunit RPC12/RpoP
LIYKIGLFRPQTDNARTIERKVSASERLPEMHCEKFGSRVFQKIRKKIYSRPLATKYLTD